MKKLKTILLDDEQTCIDTLEWVINKNCTNLKIIKTFTSTKKAKKYLSKNKVDVLFLDIEMPILNGFSFLKNLNNINFKIIFVTAYNKYAIKAFKYTAFDYLLKPVTKDDLIKTEIRLLKSTKAEEFSKLQNLFHFMQNKPSSKLLIPTLNGADFINANEVVFVKSQSNYSKIFFDDKKTIVSTKSLKNCEKTLVKHSFFRIHNSYLINMNKVKKYYRGNAAYLIMNDDSQIPISRSKKDAFLTIFKE